MLGGCGQNRGMTWLARTVVAAGVGALLVAVTPMSSTAAPVAADLAVLRTEAATAATRHAEAAAAVDQAQQALAQAAEAHTAAETLLASAERMRPVVQRQVDEAEAALRSAENPRTLAGLVGRPADLEAVRAARTWVESSRAGVRTSDIAILTATLDEHAAQVAHESAEADLASAVLELAGSSSAHAELTARLAEQLAAVDPSRGTLALPAVGAVTSPFGHRVHPVTGDHRLHTGMDFEAGDGGAYAAAAGTVVSAGWNGAYGLEVVVDHGSGVRTQYAHLAALAVTAGQAVQVGDRLGTIGSTGSSTGPHLHFEVVVDGSPVDPRGWLD